MSGECDSNLFVARRVLLQDLVAVKREERKGRQKPGPFGRLSSALRDRGYVVLISTGAGRRAPSCWPFLILKSQVEGKRAL